MRPLYVLGTILISIILWQCSPQKSKSTLPSTQNPGKTNAKSEDPMSLTANDYPDFWRSVDSVMEIGQWQTATKMVETHLESVKGVNNQPQWVRCLAYLAKNKQASSENGTEEGLNYLRTAIPTLPHPAKEVATSILATSMQQYLQQQLWRIRERTDIAGDNSENIGEWSLRKIVATTEQLYLDALKEAAISKAQKASAWSAIWDRGQEDSDVLRPTLYDLLLFKTLDYFATQESLLPQPPQIFQLNQEVLFQPQDAFTTYTFTSPDPESHLFRAVQLYQTALQWYVTNGNKAGLADADRLRYQFAYVQGNVADEDKLYRKALQHGMTQYTALPQVTEYYALMALHLQQEGNTYQPISKEAPRWKLKEAIATCEKGIALFPESFGAGQCRAIVQAIQNPEFTIHLDQVLLRDQKQLQLVKFRNTGKLYVRYYKLPVADQDASTLQENFKFTELEPGSIVRNETIDLPDAGDFQLHGLERAVAPLPSGRYLLVASNTPEFKEEKSTELAFQVSNLAYLTEQNTEQGNGSVYYLVHRNTGQPIAGAKITYYLRKYQDYKNVLERRGTLQTDANGKFQFEVRSNEGREIIFTVQHREDRLVSQSHYQYRNVRYPRERTKQEQFFTDRSIYRPGQTVYFKAIALQLDAEGKPSIVKGEKLKVQLRDANYQSIQTLELQSNEFGSIAGSFTLPVSGMTGMFSIATPHGQTFVNVEEYKRPKFEVKMDSLKDIVRVNQRIRVTGKAMTYSGAAVDGAKVAYTVKRSTYWPYWPWWRSWFPAGNERILINANTSTDAEGKFAIDFASWPDEQDNPADKPQYTYEVTVNVTDGNGETRSTTYQVSVGYISLLAQLSVPEQALVQEWKKIGVSFTNLNAVNQNVASTVTIKKLSPPNYLLKTRRWEAPDTALWTFEAFKKDFPNDPWPGEDNPMNWKATVIKTIALKAGVYEADVAALNLGTGVYLVELNAVDPFGEKIQVQKKVELIDPKKNALARPEFLKTHLDKPSYEPGETVKLWLGSSIPNAKVLFRWDLPDQKNETGWFTLQGGQWLTVPVKEDHRGNIGYTLIAVNQNRVFMETKTINVPWTNKDLQISIETFRDKLLPGQKETWKIKISGPGKDKAAAELLAGMYDASLDVFRPHSWNKIYWPTRGTGQGFYFEQFNALQTNYYAGNDERDYQFMERIYRQIYPQLILEGYAPMIAMSRNEAVMDSSMAGSVPPSPAPEKRMSRSKTAPGEGYVGNAESLAEESGKDVQSNSDIPPPPRTNLKETVFFFPQMRTDASGNIVLEFTMNEALTRWKLMLLGHNQNLASAYQTREVVTQKELMLAPNPPRFFREGDTCFYTAKVTNLSAKPLSGKATLQLSDASNGKKVNAVFGLNQPEQSFEVPAGQSVIVNWPLTVPYDATMVLTHTVSAVAGNFSDAEENSLPVLTNRTLVTETLPIWIRGNQNKTMIFQDLVSKVNSPTLQTRQYTVEFSSNPVWYAVQALPYLMEYPHECTEQMFNRFYANSLATEVVRKTPQIKAIYDKWKKEGGKALQSNLYKNQELKQALLEETPWVLQASNENEQKKNIALLFDLQRMADEQQSVITKLLQRQGSDGGFPWFPGGPGNWYITQYVLEGIQHLRHLGIALPENTNALENGLLRYCDGALNKHYNDLKKQVADLKGNMADDHLDPMSLHYLYVRSFIKEKVPVQNQEAFDYYLGQANKYWTKQGYYDQALIALATHRFKQANTPGLIIRAFREQALRSEELGQYWKYNRGWYWNQHPIETQAMMVEVFSEIEKDQVAVDEMRIWLLKQKQVQQWPTTKATAAAVYALLLNGSQWLQSTSLAEVSIGGRKVEPATSEPGTGYFKTTWTGQKIDASWGQVAVKNPNPQIAWGAVYWQYLEDIDKVKSAVDQQPLTVRKRYFKKLKTDRGPQLVEVNGTMKLQPGDELVVRLDISTDRDMQFIHLKDLRAAGVEPVDVLSQYRWQGGLGYYQSTKDLATHFFFDYLAKGQYSLEYSCFVQQRGNFSAGLAHIQNMYAPEFSAHSQGFRIQVQ